MHKTLIVSALAVVLFASSASAATFVLSPARIDTSSGQEFSLYVSVNPQGTKDYTSKVVLEYPASLLEVKSFSFGNSWMALAQPGYDLIDNTAGKLIKTAGYPKGFSNTVVFGTVTFKAKKIGTAYVKVGANSLIYNSSNKNVFSGLPTAVVGISAAQINPALPGAPAEEGIGTTEPSANVASDTNAIESAPAGKASASMLDTIVSFGKQNIYFSALIALAVISLIVYGVKKSKRKKIE